MNKNNNAFNFESTSNMNNKVMKTSHKGFANAIKDFTEDLAKIVTKGIVALPSSFYKSYSLSYLILKSLKHSEFNVENVVSRKKYQNGMSFNSVCSFDYRLNIDDCDIVLRVSAKRGYLYIGGICATSINCPNGAFIHILKELYTRATHLGVAA